MFDVDHSTFPPSCLPSDLDSTDLIDITELRHAWRVFMEPNGRIHDGAVYFEQMQALILGQQGVV